MKAEALCEVLRCDAQQQYLGVEKGEGKTRARREIFLDCEHKVWKEAKIEDCSLVKTKSVSTEPSRLVHVESCRTAQVKVARDLSARQYGGELRCGGMSAPRSSVNCCLT